LLSASIRKLAATTTCSPSFTPSMTSTYVSLRAPSLTSRGSKRPSPFWISTIWRVPLSMTADTGTLTTGPFADTDSSTCANMAGLSSRPGLASSTRTGTVRVSALSVG
jgi:hypothetical protein